MVSVREQDLVMVVVFEVGRFRVCFKVVLVKIRCLGGVREIIMYVFLDSGLDVLFCLDSLVCEIGVMDMKLISYIMIIINCVDGELRYGYEVQLEIELLEGDVKF